MNAASIEARTVGSVGATIWTPIADEPPPRKRGDAAGRPPTGWMKDEYGGSLRGPHASGLSQERGMTSRELLIIGGGILLAILVIPFGGAEAPIGVALIALFVVWDIARERRRRGL